VRRRTTGRRGFTLIEVLVALSVLGVTMTAVFTLFSSGLKLREATRERMGFNRDARLLVGALTDDLANLVPAGPEPMVSADSIVLWRTRPPIQGVDGSRAVAELVTYQWSGSDTQDSLLVRVAVSLEDVDISDFEAVEKEFLKWARTFSGGTVATRYLVREDDGPRFGSRATLNGLSGAWRGYPDVRGFACALVEEMMETLSEETRSRILLRLSGERFTAYIPGLDALSDLELLPPEEAGLDVGLWLPVSARVLAPEEIEDVVDEAAAQTQEAAP